MVIFHIRVGVRIIIIETTLHALEVFTTQVRILVDAPIVEKSKPKLNPLVEFITEHVVRLVDELVISVKQVNLDV